MPFEMTLNRCLTFDSAQEVRKKKLFGGNNPMESYIEFSGDTSTHSTISMNGMQLSLAAPAESISCLFYFFHVM